MVAAAGKQCQARRTGREIGIANPCVPVKDWWGEGTPPAPLGLAPPLQTNQILSWLFPRLNHAGGLQLSIILAKILSTQI